MAAVDITKPLDLEDNPDEGTLSVPIQLAHDRTKKERSLDVQLTGEERDVTFLELGLRDSTILGLKKCGFKVPSPIQLKAIPLGKFGYGMGITLIIICTLNILITLFLTSVLFL